MKKNLRAFTLVEIIVSATILVILTTIWFYSYTNNIADARDGRRKSDIVTLWSQLSLYKKQRGAFPLPWDNFQITNRWYLVANQWFMNQKVSLSTAENLVLDPELDIPYTYSTSRNKQEYQIAMSLENNDTPVALVSGNYKSVSKNILPSIVVAVDGSWAFEIGTVPANKNFFILDTGFHNIPYDFDTWAPQADGTTLTWALNDVWDTYWQNTDYRNCDEIFTAAKWITPSGSTDEYQILNTSWVLTNTGCTAP